MVSVFSFATVAFSISSLANAAAISHKPSSSEVVEKPRSESENIISIPTSYLKMNSSKITMAPRTTSSEPRPWYLDEFSRLFIENAVDIRSKNVSEATASSVAKHLVDAGLDHPQYTVLASEAMQMWVDYGFNPNAGALYKFATDAKSAHDEINGEVAYWEYIDYVKTTAASVFDLSLLEPTGAMHSLNGIAASRVSRFRSTVTSRLSSLYADPTGSAALKTLNDVYNAYDKDFEGSDSSAVKLTSGVVEQVLQSLFNVF